jgi:hypothetical protein
MVRGQWVVAEGAGLGVCAGVGELLAVADGLDVALPDGVGVAWLGPGEGVAVAEAVGAAPPFAGPADEVVVAIRIPATIATMPVLTPTASNTRVQVEAGAVPDSGPSPVTGMPLWAGLTCAAHRPGRHSGSKSIWCPRASSANNELIVRTNGAKSANYPMTD